jgi:cell division protein FtsB
MNLKKVIEALLVILLFVLFINRLVSQQKTLTTYSAEVSEYQSKLETELSDKESLEDTINNLNSTEFIESVAREKLDMYLPNEKIYVDISK